jgi:hypothetical protein
MIVTTPMFLTGTTEALLHQAIHQVGNENNAEVGDEIVVNFIGMTKDSDG